MNDSTVVYTCRCHRRDDTLYEFHDNIFFRRYVPPKGLTSGRSLTEDILRDIRDNVSEDAELYRAIISYGYSPIATYIPTFYAISGWLRGDSHVIRPQCAIYDDGILLLSDTDLTTLGLLDSRAVKLLGRRMRDEPLNAEEFQSYLSELSAIIESRRR